MVGIKLITDGEDTNLILTAGLNDGVLNAIDMRMNTKAFSKKVHGGAINFILQNKDNLVITGSADKSVKIWDANNEFAEVGTLKSTDAIFCGDLYENLLVVGCGDGNMLAYDINTMECLYGYGCDNVGGVKNIKIIPEKNIIVTSGDSGQGLILHL